MSTSVFSWIFGTVFFLRSLLPVGGLSLIALPLMVGSYSGVGESLFGGGMASGGGETDPGLDYPVIVSYDPAAQIQRTTLDTGDLDLSVYLEVPVFQDAGQGYQRINSFFQDVRGEFFSYSNESLESIFEIAGDPAYPADGYLYENNAAIHCQEGGLVSVSIYYSWYMGGVMDYGSDCYTFRTSTGELLALTDVTSASEQELREAVRDALEKQDEGMGDIDGSVAERELDSYDFYIQDGRIYLSFDKYEASYGAYGAFDVELEVPLSLRA